MQETVAYRSARGFSLIELMITIVIAGVLLALAFPSFRTIMGDSNIVGTTNDFVSSVHAARSEAVKRGGRAGLCPSDDPLKPDAVCSPTASWSAGWIVFADANEDGDRDHPADELLVQMEPRLPGFTIAADDVYQKLIYFSPDGISITQTAIPITGAVKIQYGAEDERDITVSANGRVTTVEP